MNLTELRELYAPVSKTHHPRVLLGHNGPRKGQDYVLLFNDDSGDWDRSGPVYPTKAEAFANVPPMVESFFGTPDPAAPGTLPTPADPPTPGVLPFTVTGPDDPFTVPTHTGQTTLMIAHDASFRAHNLFTQAARELFNLTFSDRARGAARPVRVWFEHQTTSRQGYDYAAGNLLSWDLTPSKVGRMTFEDGTELFDRLLVRVTF